MRRLQIQFLRDQIFKQFQDSIFQCQKILQSLQKCQNNTLTKHGVIWNILKANKIRKGMNLRFCGVF